MVLRLGTSISADAIRHSRCLPVSVEARGRRDSEAQMDPCQPPHAPPQPARVKFPHRPYHQPRRVVAVSGELGAWERVIGDAPKI